MSTKGARRARTAPRESIATPHARGARPAAQPVDERRRLGIIIGLSLALGIILFALAYAHQSVPLAGIDAEDYGQMGRQIATGQGFSSLFMPLNGLAFLKERGLSLTPPWPNISRFPLPPLVMALIFRIFGASDLAVAGYSLIGYLAAVPFAVLIGRRLGGLALAAFAGILVVAHPDALQLAYSGLTEPLSGTVLLAAAWLVIRRDVRSHLLAGAVFGLGYWNRTTLLALAVPAAVMIWQTATRRRDSLLAFGLAAAAIAAPWAIWTWVLTGSPFFNLQNASVLTLGADPNRPDFAWYQLAYQAAAPDIGAALAKWIHEATTIYEILPDTLGPIYLLIFAIVGWWFCPPALRRLRWLLLVWILLQIAIYSFAGNISRFYTILLPFVTLFGGLGILTLARRVFSSDRLAILSAAVIALLVALPSIGAITGIRNFEGSPSRDDVFSAIVDVSLDNGPYVASKVAPNGLVLSNMPWSVAWRAARPAAPIPPRPADLDQFERDTGLRVAALYLTPQMYIVGVPSSWSEWRELRGNQQPPPGYVLDRRFRDGSVLFLRQ